MNESLSFREHRIARITKARQMLSQFNEISNSRWGMSVTSWRTIYNRHDSGGGNVGSRAGVEGAARLGE